MNLDFFKIVLLIGVVGFLLGLGIGGRSGDNMVGGSLLLLAICGGYYFFIGRKK